MFLAFLVVCEKSVRRDPWVAESLQITQLSVFERHFRSKTINPDTTRILEFKTKQTVEIESLNKGDESDRKKTYLYIVKILATKYSPNRNSYTQVHLDLLIRKDCWHGKSK